MSIQIIFYTYTGKPNTINKFGSYDNNNHTYFTNKIVVSGELNQSFSMLNPIIYVNVNGWQSINAETTGDWIDFWDYNYCYIPQLRRCYFVDDLIIENNKIIRFILRNDVLQNYSYLFNTQTQDSVLLHIDRTTNKDYYSPYVVDEKIVLSNDRDIRYITDCFVKNFFTTAYLPNAKNTVLVYV